MLDEKYIPGLTYWLPDGTKCELVAEMPDGMFLIRRNIEFQGYDGDVFSELAAPEFVSKLYPKAPREVRDAELEALSAEIAKRQKQTEMVTSNLLKLHQEQINLQKQLEAYGPLKRVMEIMANQVGFVVRLIKDGFHNEAEQYTKIPYAEWLKTEAHYRSFPVLTLEAGPGYSNPVWKATSRIERLNGKEIWFCANEAEAEQTITDIIAAEFHRVFFNNSNRAEYIINPVVRIAQRSGRPVPVEVSRWLITNQLSKLRSETVARLTSIEADKPKIAELEQQLAALQEREVTP